MLINFNIEKLNSLLYDFYSITGITISVWNSEFQQLSFQPRKMCAFCRTIKSTEEGKRACFLSDQKLCLECGRTDKPSKHVCHAGLVDLAFPIKYKDTILGYIMFGQISDKSEKEMQPVIERLGKTLGIDTNVLTEGYRELIQYNEDIIDSAARILKLATRYLWLSEYIDIGHDAIASKIDEYIQTHLSEKITVSTICQAVNIPKKRLYSVSSQNFGIPIGEYITLMRINEAKRLLESTDLSIQQIACMVGIQDYNYFSKFFKLHVGTSPLKYRKQFPFNLHPHTNHNSAL